MEKNDILNTLYHSLLMAAATAGYSYLFKNVLKMRVGDPSSPNVEEIVKLGGVVAASSFTLDYLFDMGLPRNPIK